MGNSSSQPESVANTNIKEDHWLQQSQLNGSTSTAHLSTANGFPTSTPTAFKSERAVKQESIEGSDCFRKTQPDPVQPLPEDEEMKDATKEHQRLSASPAKIAFDSGAVQEHDVKHGKKGKKHKKDTAEVETQPVSIEARPISKSPAESRFVANGANSENASSGILTESSKSVSSKMGKAIGSNGISGKDNSVPSQDVKHEQRRTSNEQEGEQYPSSLASNMFADDPVYQSMSKGQKKKFRHKLLKEQKSLESSVLSGPLLAHDDKAQSKVRKDSAHDHHSTHLPIHDSYSQVCSVKDFTDNLPSNDINDMPEKESHKKGKKRKNKKANSDGLTTGDSLQEDLQNVTLVNSSGRKRPRDSTNSESDDAAFISGPAAKNKRQKSEIRSSLPPQSTKEDVTHPQQSPEQSIDLQFAAPQVQHKQDLSNRKAGSKSPQKQYRRPRGRPPLQATKTFKSAEYVVDSDGEQPPRSVREEPHVFETSNNDEAAGNMSSPKPKPRKTPRRLPVHQDPDSNSKSKAEGTFKRKRRKQVATPELSADAKRHGAFGEDEKKILGAFKQRHCREEGISHDQFLAKVHGSAHNDPIRKQFWNDMRDALPQRDNKSLQRFCRRHWPAKDVLNDPFSPEDDQELIKLVASHGSRWVNIGALMDRDPGVVRDRYRNVLKDRATRTIDPWTEEEILKLRHAMGEAGAMILKNLGPVDNLSKHIVWGTISQKMFGSRGRSQCAYKWTMLKSKGEASLAEEIHAANQRLGINPNVKLEDIANMSGMFDESFMLKLEEKNGGKEQIKSPLASVDNVSSDKEGGSAQTSSASAIENDDDEDEESGKKSTSDAPPSDIEFDTDPDD